MSLERQTEHQYRLFIWSVAGLLALTAILKLLTLGDNGIALDKIDPVLPMTLKSVLLLAVGYELAVAVVLVSIQRQSFAMRIILWTVVNFTLYRLGAAIMGSGGSCPCLGSIPKTLGLRASLADALLVMALVYMGVPSLLYVIRERRLVRSPLRGASMGQVLQN